MKENITPKKAASYLGTIKTQRPLSKYWVEELAQKMKCGKWKYTGDSIKFDVNGNLIDGQHRLSACMAAGVPFLTEITRNLPLDVFTGLDQHKRRSPSDVLSIMGKTNRTVFAGTLKLLDAYNDKEPMNITMLEKKLPNEEIARILKQHPHIEKSIEYTLSSGRINGASRTIMAFCHYVFSKKDKPKADEFFHKLLTGENLSSGDPILTLRNLLIRMVVRHRVDRWKQLSLTFRVWQAIQQREKLTKLFVPQELPVI